MVPSPCTTTRAYGTCKAIRGSLVGHRGMTQTWWLKKITIKWVYM